MGSEGETCQSGCGTPWNLPDLTLSYHTLPSSLSFAMIRIEVMIVNNKNGILKMILLALLGAFLAKGLQAKETA